MVIPYFFALFFLILGFTSCNQLDFTGGERYAVQEYYKLDSLEEVLPLDSTALQPYRGIKELGKHAFPINRAFKSTNYSTFIALTVNPVSLDRLYEDHITAASEINLIDKKKNGKYRDLFFKSDSNYVFRTIYKEPVQGYTVVINFMATDSLVIADKFANSKDYLKSKINCRPQDQLKEAQ